MMSISSLLFEYFPIQEFLVAHSLLNLVSTVFGSNSITTVIKVDFMNRDIPCHIFYSFSWFPETVLLIDCNQIALTNFTEYFNSLLYLSLATLLEVCSINEETIYQMNGIYF